MDLTKYAEELRCSTQEIDNLLGSFRETSTSRILTHVQRGELQRHIAERQQKLEKCSHEDLKTIQGEIAGLRLAADVITLQK